MKVKTFPLMFGFVDLLPPNVCVLGVGSVLLEQDQEDAWLFGVQPGGFAGGGETIDEALLDFRKGYREILAEVWSEAGCELDPFSKNLQKFFEEVCQPNYRQWTHLINSGTNFLHHGWIRSCEVTSDCTSRYEVKEIPLDNAAIFEPSTTWSLLHR